MTLEEEKIIISEIISALLENRDYLGHRLSYEQGRINSKEFEIIQNNYFNTFRLQDDDLLLIKIKVLRRLVNTILDVNTLSVILKCDCHQAERLLKLL